MSEKTASQTPASSQTAFAPPVAVAPPGVSSAAFAAGEAPQPESQSAAPEAAPQPDSQAQPESVFHAAVEPDFDESEYFEWLDDVPLSANPTQEIPVVRIEGDDSDFSPFANSIPIPQDGTPVGMAPIGAGPAPLAPPARMTEIRKLYSIVFGLTFSGRILCYLAAVGVFFALPTTWPTAGLIAALVAGGQVAGRAHTWAWRGWRDHSARSTIPGMKERLAFEEEQDRIDDAAREAAALMAGKGGARDIEEVVQQVASRSQQASQTAAQMADETADIERERAHQAAVDAKRLAEEALAKANELLS